MVQKDCIGCTKGDFFMIKAVVKCCLCVAWIILLSACSNQSSSFLVVSDYDYFMDAGDLGFYKKGDLYGFINLNGQASELKPFTLEDTLSEAINLETVKCFNGLAVFSTVPSAEGGKSLEGFMDLQGNVVMKEEWEGLSVFNSSGYASVYDERLAKYVIIDKSGETVRESQAYIEPYYPYQDIFILSDASDSTSSHWGYYVLDKDLKPLLDDLQVYYKSGPELAHTRQYTLFGNSEKFIYKKDNKYYIYQIASKDTIAEFNDYEALMNNEKDFIEECEATYADYYEHKVMTESYNGVFIEHDESGDRYWLTDENGKKLFEPDPDITGLTYLKEKVIRGISRTTGKTVVIFNKNFKYTGLPEALQ